MFVKIGKNEYDSEKLTFEDFKAIAGENATKEKYEQLTGKKIVTKSEPEDKSEPGEKAGKKNAGK